MLPRGVPRELDVIPTFQVVNDGKLYSLGTYDGHVWLDGLHIDHE